MPPPVFVGFLVTNDGPSPPAARPAAGCASPSALTRALSPSDEAAALRRVRCLAKASVDTYADTEEAWDEDGSDDDEDESLSGRTVPEPRDPAHYKSMVYARAVLNAKMWAAQA